MEEVPRRTHTARLETGEELGVTAELGPARAWRVRGV